MALSNGATLVTAEKHFERTRHIYGVRYSEGPTTSALTVENLTRRYVEDIKRVYPSGPFVLIGHSMGGIIAYEMARQLNEQQQSVQLLAMIDTTHPDYHWERMSLWRKAINDIKIARTLSLKRLPSFLALKVRNLFAAQKAQSTTEPTVMTQFEMLSHVGRSYTPTSYGAKMVLFRASERKKDDVILDETLGWADVATVDVHHIQSSHNGMLAEPDVAEIARHVRDYLISI